MVDDASSLQEPAPDDDHAFSSSEVAELAAGTGNTPAATAEVIDQTSQTARDKRRRAMLLKLLIFLRQLGH